ncbi:MAG: hypothetical protein KDD94_15145, partial [Calditrichaeota bacterium]|nr:hypothetical protein [Calditrichota bacterium]
IRFDYRQPHFKYLYSEKNRRQFRSDYDHLTNMIYSLRRINELSIFNNRTKIEEFSYINQLINSELELW